MISKNSVILAVILAGLLLTGPACGAAVTQDTEAVRLESLEDQNRVRDMGQALDLEALEKLAPQLEKKWFSKDIEHYGYVMRGICGAFGSFDYDDSDKADALARKYAMLALEKSHKLPEASRLSIEHEIYLLLRMQWPDAPKRYGHMAQEEDWADQRQEIAKLYFSTWVRLLTAIDKDWDPNGPTMKVPRPLGKVGPSWPGMSPDLVKDPGVRAEYEAALEKHREERRWTSEQRLLRRLAKYNLPQLQKHLLRLYSGPSFDCKELEVEALQHDLHKCIQNKDVRVTILADLRTRLQAESEPKKEPAQQDGKGRSRRMSSRTATVRSQVPD